MPESRHRKTNKAKKRSRGSYPATSPSRPTGKNRRVRTIAIVLVVLLALSAIGYVLINRGKGSGNEITTASGLRYTDIVEGTGPMPQPGQTLSVHYTGTLENGTKFDSSRDKNTPYSFQFGVTSMIKGWDEGISTMKVGGRRRLIVPPSLGYGRAGRAPSIPPNATLVFDIELLSAK